MAEQEKKTVLSGIQPSGSPTLGNYVGALKNWKLLQTDDRLCYYCVANLHALTVRQDPTDLRRRAGETVALLLACVLTFAMAGQVVWAVGIPAGICGIAGGYVGSGLALKNGTKVIRPMFFVVLALLTVRLIYDLLFS